MWDDPLFTNSTWTGEWGPQNEVIDPEFIELRRECRLLAVEVMYMDLHRLQEELAGMREVAGRAVWT